MRKTILLICLGACMVLYSKAQTNTFPTSGKAGIGTTAPISTLDIKQDSSGKALVLKGVNFDLDFCMGHDGSTYGYFWRYKGTGVGNLNALQLWSNNLTGADLQIYNVYQDGKMQFFKPMGIACEAQEGYSLAVNGKIKATEIKVETGWADFVFKPGFQLRSLKEVESFIDKNGHLPDIPSESEVSDNGISLGEINAKLLQKIEELTLYTIEQEKKILILQNDSDRIDRIENELLLLKKLLENN